LNEATSTQADASPPSGRPVSATHRRSLQWAFAVWLVATLVAVLAALNQQRENKQRLERAFDLLVSRYVDQVQSRFGIYEYGLRGARGVVVAADPDRVSRLQFKSYSATRDLEREFPGALGFGYIRRVEARDRERFEAAARAEERPGFSIRQLSPNDGSLYVIQYIEPEADNAQAVGLDIASEGRRRQAALDSARTGSARLTAPITLVQATGRPLNGFLLVLPVYRPGLPINTDEQRLAAVAGWSYAPLLIQDVLHDIVLSSDPIALSLRDADEPASDPPFFSTEGFTPTATPLARSIAMTIFGRRWQLEVLALPAFADGQNLLSPKVVGGLGSVAALVLALLAQQLFAARGRRLAQRQERDALTAGVIDASPQAIIVADAAGRIVRANRRVEAVFGYLAAELIGQPVEILLPMANRERHVGFRRRYDHVSRPMGSRSELLGRHASGREFHVQVHLSPLSLGEQRLVVAGVLDVSAEYEALRNLRASEARWKQLANSMPQLVWTCLGEGPCDFLSSQWLTYTGVAEVDQLGYGWLEQIHPEDRENLLARWQDAVRLRAPMHVEFRIRRHDGVFRWFDTQAIPLIDDKEQLYRWIGTNTDIEDRKRAEEKLVELNATLETRIVERTAALEAARRDLRNILDAMPSMVGYWDTEERNRFANHAYRVWFGVDPDWLPGRKLEELLGPELYEKNRPYVEGALRGEAQSFEREIPSPEGGSRHSLASYLPDIVDGQVRGFYVLVHDITDVRRAQAAAEAASHAKSVFLANMSHEIRTPMNAVINLTYLLEQSSLDQEQRELLDKIKIASRSLLGVINDVLDLSKIEAGQLRVTSEAFALRGVAEDVVKLMSAAAQDRKLSLELNVAQELPVYVRGDALRVTQMLSNLVSNAIKFTERGSVRVDVERDRRYEDHVRFVVEDTGIGIAPEVLEKLFRPFTQGDESTTRRYGGTGLGLAIVQRLTELMGGETGVTSTPGRGSRFWFSVPLRAEEEAMHAASAPKGLETLIVDDDQAQRELLAGLARALGWRVEMATTGPEALLLIGDRARSGKPFDLLIVDWRMPVMDGLDLVRRLRHQGIGGSDPTIVLITAFDAEGLRRLPDARLADAVLAKPVSASMLFNAIQDAVSRRQTRRAVTGVSAPSPAAQPGTRLHGVRILLVDDSSINLEVGRRILQYEGAVVTTAANGQQALDRLREQSQGYEVVLMDVQMPVIDGHEATRRIRNELGLSTLPIIAVTAGALLSERKRALEAGMDDFISKPFDADALIRLVATQAGRAPGPQAGVSVAGSPTPDRATASASSPAWPSIEGIDPGESRARLGGDVSLLKTALRLVLNDYADIGPSLDPKGDVGAAEALARRIHKLRGTSGTIGATMLYRSASELETQLRTAPAQSGESLLAGIASQIATIRAAAWPLLQSEMGAAEELSDTVSAADPPDAEALRRLLAMLESQSLDALDAYEHLRTSLQTILPAAVYTDFAKAMAELQFPQARAILVKYCASRA
jgi:PAS domain S-box-containing protein